MITFYHNVNIFLCKIKHVFLLNVLFGFSALVVFLILSFIPYASASEEVLLTRYGYGSLIWDGEKHDAPAIWQYFSDLDYSTNKIFNNYELSDAQNEFNKSKYKLDVRLKVRQKDGNLLAMVTFYNGSVHSFYIYRNRLPADLYFYPLCGNAFSINADSIHLDYLGRRCQFDDGEEKKSWHKIRAGETYDFTVKLNDAYAFPPGIRRYNIRTLEYSIVKDEWFIEQSIFSSLFSILKWQYTCEGRKSVDFIDRVRWSCEFGYPDIEDFFSKLGYYGLSDDDYFEIRTNQVNVLIDGSALHSFYKND
ncbi:hypothetical protein CHU32_19995 [Superficieibacter electus]|uniref:Uncharacterized protein n=1 Tax=Superficieibacter electus TaxID=2022662 RepID=A0A2P5GKY9_9ENTR|nr:hypothetical protein [Superficieibacter electus]MDU4436165.1 hypothetical protein [Pluralibacter gergoviae]POP44154.1 hypothetical protein CHU33_14305 [Superficieibacter electus]POP45483.1 hypothetical protein CHU32_19995 [Superficieibacter electus]